jgi:deoxyribonuclease-4
MTLLGAHLSIAGGTPRAIRAAEELDCTALQIFVKNASRWTGPSIGDEESRHFRDLRSETRLRSVVAHGSYLINLASPDAELWRRSISAVLDELRRSEALGLDFLVLHPGSHLKTGEANGVRRVSRALNRIHQESGELRARIALETTAGQGTNLGYLFEHLRDMIAGCDSPERLGVCLDTCHIFAAGYEIREKEHYQSTMARFEEILGIRKLVVVHLNDSKRELGSRVDRHEHIGQGEIGLAAFESIMNDSRLKDVPKILETPKGEDGREDRRNLEKLRSLVVNGP